MQRVARLYLSVSLAATGMVRCPRPGCESGVIPRTPGRVEKCICECRYAFCSLCQVRAGSLPSLQTVLVPCRSLFTLS